MWNELFYRSCDLILAISKQTYGINKRILPDYEDWQIKYIPHGINPKRFFPVHKQNNKFRDFEHKFKPNLRVLLFNGNIKLNNMCQKFIFDQYILAFGSNIDKIAMACLVDSL